RARDPDVDDAVLDVLGNVVRPDEEEIDRRVLARHVQRPLSRLEAQAGSRKQLQRRRRHPPLRRDGDQQAALGGRAHRCRLARSAEREPVAPRAVAQPLGDAGDGCGARVNPPGDLQIRERLVEEANDLPAVRERLELAERAEVAQEAGELVPIAEREDRVRELVQPGDLAGFMSRPFRRCDAHISMLACYYESMDRFDVIPAIDVLKGRCVRLFEGHREHVTIEGGDPRAAAARFAAEGAEWLHLVDLGGAFSGRPTAGLVETVAAAGVPVQAGGGLRDAASIDAALRAGAARVVVGTAAAGPDLTHHAERYGEELVVAVDARDGRVVTNGWVAETELTAAELARRCAAAGVRRLLVTSTRRDGSLAGPDLALLEEVLGAGLPVLAAGGIAELDDLRRIRELGCEGAVVGSALWSGRFTLAQALAA